MKLLYSVFDSTNELYKGDKDRVTSWLRKQSDVSGLIVVKVGGSLEYTVDEFLSNMVPSAAKKYSIVKRDMDKISSPFESTAERVVEWLKKSSDVSKYEVFDSSAPVGSQYMSVDQFLRQRIIPEFYSQVVPKYYQMDPQTEDLLPSGRHLANGMKILTANPNERVRPEEANTDWMRNRLMELNRWQTVTNLAKVGETLIRWVGVYDDGVKVYQRCSVDEAWLVKKDSIAASLEQESERFNTVCSYIHEAVRDVMLGENEDGVDFEPDLEVERIVEATAKAILGSIG